MPTIKGVQPHDINNFWMATHPEDPDRGLFDPKRYTGEFVLIHGNGVNDPKMIPDMARKTRAVEGYKPKPILFNELRRKQS